MDNFVLALGIVILIILIILISLIVRSIKRKSEKMKDGDYSVPMVTRIAGYVNLAPGTPVPASGYYECVLCAQDGLMDTMARSLYGEAEARLRAAARKPTRNYFKEGETFPGCPNCKGAAGWSLLKQ